MLNFIFLKGRKKKKKHENKQQSEWLFVNALRIWVVNNRMEFSQNLKAPNSEPFCFSKGPHNCTIRICITIHWQSTTLMNLTYKIWLQNPKLSTLAQVIPIWKGQMEKICDIHEIAYRMKRSNWQNLWHAWNYDTVWQGQMAKISNIHKITHAFECGTHVNIMGPNKWN
jgi:hypothetical protein